MGLGFPSLPSLSDVRNTVTRTVTNAGEGLRDLGETAVNRTAQLGRDGLDIGRRAVDAVRSVDVREAAATVRNGIRQGTEAAREGIRDGVEWAGQRTHQAADFARSHVGGDSLAARAVRGAITYGENSTRFQLGVVGGVTREAVGLVGTVGELGTSAVEMQVSSEARLEYGNAIVDGVQGAARSTGNYISSVANDPGRLQGDVSGVVDAGERFVGAQVDRYEQAIREGRGPETIGMDVGTVATYVIPVGGGPARGALTAAVRGGGEAALRGTGEAIVRTTGETLVRGTTTAATREGAELAMRQGSELAVRETSGTVAAIAPAAGRTPAAAATMDAGGQALRHGDDYGVAFFGRDNVRFYTPENATLGREGGAFFHMPIADSVLVTDAASAARYTGHAPSALEAYKTGGEIFGISFPRAGLGARVPTAADAGGYVHFLEGGHTAVRTEGPLGGFLVNPTREFVIPGGQAVPPGSVLFRVDGAAWTPIRQF